MTRLAAGAAAGAAGLALLASAGCAPSAASAARPLRIDVRMRLSKFIPSVLTVPAGRPITFVLHNEDFIDHEFIVGDSALQRRHETGTDIKHAAGPTAVDVPAGQSVETVVTFEPAAAGLTYACHVPGHFAYGMAGALTIR